MTEPRSCTWWSPGHLGAAGHHCLVTSEPSSWAQGPAEQAADTLDGPFESLLAGLRCCPTALSWGAVHGACALSLLPLQPAGQALLSVCGAAWCW